jgi:hypothetical protein
MRTSGSSLPRAVAVLIAAGLLSWAGQAHAFCREVAETPPTNYDPTVSGCFTTDLDGGAIPPLFWRNQCVSYSFQVAGSKTISASDTTRIAAQAFAAWTTAACPGGGSPNIFADQYPAVQCDNAESQGHNNVIIFRDGEWPHDSANALGYTTLTIRTSTGEIIGAGIEINAGNYNIVADAPTPDAGTMTYDLGSILTHEAGHFLGLAHSPDTSAVMYAHYHPGTTVLTPDDISGICTIYSPDGTRNTAEGPVAASTCEADPPLGFSSACGTLDSGTYVGSGPLPEGGEGDGGDPPCTGEPSCSAGGAAGSGAAPGNGNDFGLALGIAGGVFVVIGGLARRRLARSAGARGASIVAIVGTGSLGLSLLGARDARASVSAEALFEQLVQEANAAAVVTPVDQRSAWENGRIVTFTRVRIDRLVAGAVASDARGANEAWVRTLGGAVGDIGQLVEGEASFPIGRPSLVFLELHRDPVTKAADGSLVVVERAQGQFPIAMDAPGNGGKVRLTLAGDLGALVPPPPDHWTRASKPLPPGRSARFARDVLQGRALDEATREIAAVWAPLH